jgi:hypothetical protein
MTERYMILTAYKISLRILVKTGKDHAFHTPWEQGNIRS